MIIKIKLLIGAIRLFLKQCKIRGLYDASKWLWVSCAIITCKEENRLKILYEKKHLLNLNYMSRYYNLSKYKLPQKEIAVQYRIWVAWWQGEKEMPEIVSATYKSICKNSGKEVILITKDNYKDYIDIPETIRKKVDSGIMRLPALSDLIRVSLLDRYGGMWVDSTVLMTSQMPEWCFEKELFSVCDENSLPERLTHKYVACGRWNVQVLGTKYIHYPLFSFMRQIWIDYWLHNDGLIDYLLVDYSIAHIYDNNKEVRDAINAIPATNRDMHKLLQFINEPYNEQLFTQLCTETWLYKMTYKGKLTKWHNNKKTFYNEILESWM